MRSLWVVIVLTVALVLQPVFADSSLRMKLNGNLKNMYLYMETVGCVNIAAGSKGHIFPMLKGEVQSIVLIDRTTYRMYPQKMPVSCQIAIKDQNKKVTISGTIGHPVNDNIVIRNLQCSVS